MEERLHLEKPKAPCREACPAGIDVPRYIRHLREGRFAEALRVIRERIPFPSVCGHACVHPCEQKCARVQLDEAVAIRMLKKVAAERGGDKPVRVSPAPPTGKRVAVVGSGPCGMTAAYTLNALGHRVTVYESLAKPGGMLTYGIPGYRLPDKVVEKEIARIVASGVELVLRRRIVSAEALKKKGFDAVLAATGAWKPLKMGIPGEASRRVIDGIAFLKEVNEGKALTIGTRVVVVGGGNTAIDSSRAARRLGAEVILLYRRTRAEMPAAAEEVAEAAEEGVRIVFLTTPVRIARGKVTCVAMKLGEPGPDGRPVPVPQPGSEHAFAFDILIMAVGQAAEASAVGLPAQRNGAVRVKGSGSSTTKKGIFAAGDAVMGPSSIIEAIAQGRLAAEAIDRFLGGDGLLREEKKRQPAGEPPEAAPRGTMRPVTASISLPKRLTSFAPVERTLGPAAAAAEASRCLSCDWVDYEVTVNELLCKDCGYCREICTMGVFAQSGRFNPAGYLPAVAAHAERCVGCLRCLYICPDFSIAIRQKASGS
ncbi:MAG: FAD-dependent oxidoreductase [Deltaproteobacteria bacterium]|nr:FAD-dependent oxidoreductase [Deltaproteobacteria bacterium]